MHSWSLQQQNKHATFEFISNVDKIYVLSKRLNLILWLSNNKTATYAQSLF